MLRGSFDVLVVGFPAQEAMLTAVMMTRKPIIADMMTSHYEGYVEDRHLVSGHGMKSRWYRWLDTFACRHAAAVLVDTREHEKYFVERFGADHEKIHVIPVGTDTALFEPGPQSSSPGPFRVHFHGYYIPLQGVRYIVRAAEMLRGEDIEFTLVGTGQTFAEDSGYVHAHHLDRVLLVPRVRYAELPGIMSKAHVVLGIFGDTVKTQRVIPNKAYEALAMGLPLITADTPAVRELLDDTSAILIPACDPRAIADAILRLRADSALRRSMGDAGRRVLLQHATPAILGGQVAALARTLRI
jgi:glycosyltransferase involved in cell wall biosynthesis